MPAPARFTTWSETAAPRSLVRTIEQARKLRAIVAREDVNEFIEFVMRDDVTSVPMIQGAVHERFQEAAANHPRCLIWSHLEAGKTTQLAIGRALWILGKNPNHRIAIISRTQTQASKILRAIKGYIERSAELRLVFPHLVPGAQWNDRAIAVKRTSYSKDPSVQVFGVGVGSIQGARIDLAILDDVLTYENTRTAESRAHVFDWYLASVAGRVNPDGGQVIVVGNAFHPEDLLHRLAAQPSWHAERFPVLTEDGFPAWPEHWPLDKIEEKREELGPHEFARQMLCLARDESANHFSRDAIKKCLDRGEGRQPIQSLQYVPQGFQVFTGVDLATGRSKKKGDLTVLFTIALHPNGDREVLCVESGRWQAPEIVRRIVDCHKRFHSIIVVESNAAQIYIQQFISASTAVPIIPFQTGTNKMDPRFGVRSLAVEMANSKWIIPSQGGTVHPEIAAWIQQMVYYDPHSHTGDHLMASWFAREATRAPKPKPARISHVNTLAR